ncbi:unnamed protein product [Macrosiphum euphorbiae]|uniref:Uncharacterized protein n=1 Tax=Macrosiphum euphorbiae TaxID=13131 RepID=A0AAV0VMN3_9HEMI|nr:unnamed protein product [Macrosiphum euphorbiae]
MPTAKNKSGFKNINFDNNFKRKRNGNKFKPYADGLKIHKSTIGLTGQNDVPAPCNLKLMDFQFGVFDLGRSRDLGKSSDPLTF